MKMKKQTRMGVIVLIIMLLVSQAAIFASGASEKDEDGKSISMIHFMSPAYEAGDANDKAFAASMAEYRENHPDINVADEFVQHDNYQVKIKTMIASNTLPNVYYSKPDLFPLLRENNMIMPLTDMIETDPEFKALFKEGAFNDFIFDGDIWAIPFQLQSNHVVYYNKAMFREVGFNEFPKTMSEFKDLVSKLKNAGYIPISMGNKGRWLNPSCIFNTMVYRFTDASWFNSLYNDEGATFNDKPFVDAAKLMSELVSLGAFNEDMNSIDNNQQRVLFYNEEAAMFIEGSWALGPVMDNMSEEQLKNVGLAILPAIDGMPEYANIVAGGPGWGIVINPDMSEATKDVVIEFVKELYGQTFANAAAANGGFPAVKPMIDEDALHPLQVAYNNIDFEFAPIFDVQLPGSIVDVFYNDMQQLLINEITPEEYAQNIENVR
ncbi:MAG: extracellular solute-binding protein [Sphaerochaetaceae bacterium]|nr:extracellular solute-binding protein [Sphaerochaetaceae bacterium]MDC7250629.1 extracellular solute-binding protein [Sphaerochaetaceae bacterium]